MKDLLLKYGFYCTNILNALTKGKRYNAVISKTNEVTITRYTPNTGRYLDCKTFKDEKDLSTYLKLNH